MVWCPQSCSFPRGDVLPLSMSCPTKQHHDCYSQGTATVPMTRCGGAPQPRKCQWRETQSVQFDSGTVPHQLENNWQTILCATQRVPSKKQEKHRSSTHKLLNNSATPTAETTLQSVICGNKKHTPGTTCSHTLKRLPARRLPMQRRQHPQLCCW